MVNNNQCAIYGCDKDIAHRKGMPESVCSAHRPNVIRAQNLKLICEKIECSNKALSSGYCRKHTADNYDLMPRYSQLGIIHFPENSKLLTSQLRESVSGYSKCKYCGISYKCSDGICDVCMRKMKRVRLI